MLLARYMTAMARDDFSYMRPSRREGDAILPSLKSSQVEIVVAVDTSGSIRANEMDEFLSEVSALKGQMRARVTLLACDSDLSEGAPWVFEPWEEFRCPAEIQGGGGTDFRPVFKWLEEQGQRPELLVYFTDAQGQFPQPRAELSGDLAGQGKGVRTLGPAGPAELGTADSTPVSPDSGCFYRTRCMNKITKRSIGARLALSLLLLTTQVPPALSLNTELPDLGNSAGGLMTPEAGARAGQGIHAQRTTL